MANTIKIKRSAVQGKVPTVEDLLLGELALNTYDGKLYTLKNDGTDSVIEIGGTSFSTDISLQDQSSTRYYEDSANGTNYIAIRAPSSLSADVVLTLPTTDGDADQVLGTDGNGNLSWVSRVSGSGTSGDFLSTSTASEQSGYFGNIYLKDDSNTSHYLEITNSDDLTELRTLSIDVNDANRSVILSGDLNLANNFTTSGNFALTLTTTASTSITLPTSGTLATLSGVEEFSNKSFSDNVAFATGTQNAPSITFTGDTNTGIYSPGTDQVAISTNGTGRLFVDANGNVGLGTSSPSVNLDISPASGAAEVRIAGAEGQEASIRLYADQGDDAADIKRLLTDTSGNFKIQHYSGSNFVDSLVINSSGRLLVGTSSTRSIGTLDHGLQIEAAGPPVGRSRASFFHNEASSTGPGITFGKSRGTTVGSNTIVQSNDFLGYIAFCGADGTDSDSFGAAIECRVDGTPGANDMPGRLVFSTTADGASSPTERMRIDSSGRLGLGTSSPITGLDIRSSPTVSDSTRYNLQVVDLSSYASGVGGGINFGYKFNSAGDVIGRAASIGVRKENATDDNYASALTFHTTAHSSATAERMRIDSSGRVGVGNTVPGSFNVSFNNLVVGSGSGNEGITVYTGNVDAGFLAFNDVADTSVRGLIEYNHSSDFMGFRTNGSERLRITSDGKVGLGTSGSIISTFTCASTANSWAGSFGADISQNQYTGISLGYGPSSQYHKGAIAFIRTDTTNGAGDIAFCLGSTSNATNVAIGDEKVRITSTGRVGVGTTNPATTLDVNGDVTITDKIIHGGDTNTAIRFPAADTVSVETGGSEAARIDSDGRLLVGTSSVRASFERPNINVEGLPNAGITICRNNADAFGPVLEFGKTRSASLGGVTAVQSGDQLGLIRFYGANGSTLDNEAARIVGEVDGTVSGGGANDMPGRLVFSTTADGASSPTERLRITSTGQVNISSSGSAASPALVVGGDTNTGIYSPDADQLALSTNGTERLRITSAGAIGLSGANYGNAGQVLTSNGSGSAPTWQDGGGGGGVDVLEVMLFG